MSNPSPPTFESWRKANFPQLHIRYMAQERVAHSPTDYDVWLHEQYIAMRESSDPAGGPVSASEGQT